MLLRLNALIKLHYAAGTSGGMWHVALKMTTQREENAALICI